MNQKQRGNPSDRFIDLPKLYKLIIDGYFFARLNIVLSKKTHSNPSINTPLKDITENNHRAAYLLSCTIGLTGMIHKSCPVAFSSGVNEAIGFQGHEIMVSVPQLLIATHTSTELNKVYYFSNIFDDKCVPDF